LKRSLILVKQLKYKRKQGAYKMSFSFNKPDGNTFNILGSMPVFQFLSKAVDEDQGNGNVNVNGNYEDGELGLTDFKITAPEGYRIALYRMLVTVRDTGSFDSGSYGNSIMLTNGINLVNGVGDGSRPDFVITEGLPIKVNPDWGAYCFDTDLSNYGQGAEQLAARWTFAKMGRPVVLDGDIGEFAAIRVNDDLSDLLGHYFNVQGLKQKK